MSLRTILFVIAAAIGAGALFIVMKPPSPRVERVAATATAAGVAPQSQSFDMRIENRRLVSGSSVLSATLGDTVTFRVEADQSDHLHLHGYDRMLTLTPGETATLSFTADRSGRFEFELEDAGIELGALEVQPR